MNSAMVALNNVATQQGLHHLAGKDLLIKHIVTAIEICGIWLFLVQKCLSTGAYECRKVAIHKLLLSMILVFAP